MARTVITLNKELYLLKIPQSYVGKQIVVIASLRLYKFSAL